MTWLRAMMSRCAALFGLRDSDAELDEELRTHLEMAAEENRRNGMNAEEARRSALVSFGGVTQSRESFRRGEGVLWVENLQRDVLYALRQMRRSPGFATTVIGTLALGIGAATAMFTVVDHMLLRSLPYRDANRLVLLNERAANDPRFVNNVNWLDIREWQARSPALQEIAFWTGMRGRTYLEGESSALEVGGLQVSARLFSLLGVKPILGRGFDAISTDDAAGKNAGNIILSYPVWQAAFAGDRGVIGRVIHIDNTAYTVIGVMPRNFAFPMGQGPVPVVGQVWTAIKLTAADQQRGNGARYFEAIGRLKPGVTMEAVRAQMNAIQKPIAAEYPDKESGLHHAVVVLQRFSDSLVDADMKKALLALLAASGVLWLIACVNATNLLLARSTARQREIAVRGALGASNWRVVQQMMVEGLVLSAAAAVLGIGLAVGGIRLAESVRPIHLALDLSAQMNLTILAVLCGLTLLSAAVSTAWPALMAVRAPIEPALRQGGAQAGTGRRHHRLRGALVAAEIAMSLTLLVTCGLLLRTIYTLRRVPLGYRTDHIIVANLNVPAFRFAGTDMSQTLYNPLLQRTQHLHGVQAAGLMSEVPLGQTFNIMLTLRMNGGMIAATLKAVSPDIQKIFGFKMLAGRFFNHGDTPTSQAYAVVNPAFVSEYAPDKHDPASIVGIKVWNLRKNVPMYIVGVEDPIRQASIEKPSQPELEVCLCQITPESGIYQPTTMAMDLALRTDRPISEMVPELRSILRQASPELENATITTMDQIVEDSYGSQRLAAHLLEIFGGAALLLCVAGLYG
ncbi:MAG TPA: ABC transporter permease, partial [Acidobacteriaceae bacterium]|nr:ABC transporter permease [Acidobacteriaceae bacterium]